MDNNKSRGAMRKLKATVVLTVILAIALSTLADSGHAERKEVVLAQFDWPASIGIAYIMKQVLQSKLDVRATIIPLSQDVGWKTIEKGILDAAAEVWWPARSADINRYVHERKTVEMSLSYDNAPQGIVIPTWVSRKYGINDIDDLRRKAELFDLTGDGKGDMWVGTIDWSAAEIMKIKVRDYKLNLHPFTEDTWVFYAMFQKAMKQEQPIVFYYWAPDWLFSKYDLTWIKEPEYDPEKWKHVRGEPDQSYIACAWQPAKVYTIFSKKLRDRVPKAYQFFQNFHISIDEVSFIIAEIEQIPGNPKKDPDIVAKRWLADHPEIVNEWIKGAE
jgi:glycine betaine/proline transport system substrate-binding protein